MVPYMPTAVMIRVKVGSNYLSTPRKIYIKLTISKKVEGEGGVGGLHMPTAVMIRIKGGQNICLHLGKYILN